MTPPAGRRAALAAALCLALAPAGDAAARKFQMSGTWVMRNGQVFLPLQFATNGLMSMAYYHLSMGNLTGAFGFPNGPIPGQGGVTATGGAPATLRIPPHRFVEDAMALVPLPGTTLVQITTNFGIDAPYAAATLAPGGGPGSFTWCPDDPACVAGGGMLSTDPPGARVIYRAGANQFGGAMRLGLRRGGDTALRIKIDPFQVGHQPVWGAGSALRPLAVGGIGSPDAPLVTKRFLPRAFGTQPTMAPPMSSPILYPGPKVTTMYGVTTTGTGPLFYFPQVGTGPMGTPAGQFTTRHGFAATTGTVLVQDTTYSRTLFTVMGSDARTVLGAGNIAVVAGGVNFRHAYYGLTGYASFQKIKLTLAPPIPSLSPAGFAAAAALVLLAAGWALRRRWSG